MTLTAEVIVDVPTMQTDQPFLIWFPLKWKQLCKSGCSRSPPFSNGNRHVKDLLWLSKNQKNQLIHL